MAPTVLVVDDEPVIVAMMADFLTEEGYRVRCAADGRAALHDVERAPPDLIVSDVTMPGLDGVSLVRRLRQRGFAMPVILMSAVHPGRNVAGTRFLPKPFDLAQVAALVAQTLAGAG